MSKMSDVVIAPGTHPVGVLVTHIPLAVLWVAFAVQDLADGSLKMKGGLQVTQAADPLSFYVAATIIVVVALVIFVRILQAGFALADKRDA